VENIHLLNKHPKSPLLSVLSYGERNLAEIAKADHFYWSEK